MTAAPSATNPAPWPAAAYTSAFARHTRHTFSATFSGSPLTIWNVQLTIEETASPTARLTADCLDPNNWLHLRRGYEMLAVSVGYGGQAESRIFLGPLTLIERRSDGTVHIKAASAEYLLDTLPASSTTYSVSSGYTKLADVVTDLNGTSPAYTYTYGRIRAIASGTLTNPTSYASFRQQKMEATDSLLDFCLACANSLGQWLRGDQRGRASSGFLYTGVGSDVPSEGTWDVSKLILSDRWDSGTAIDLTSITETWTKRESVDDYADILLITANYKSGGSTASKVARYSGLGWPFPPLTRAIAVDYRPGAAFTAGTDPVAQRWADAYSARTWKLTATCRAVWWLEPGMQATINGTTGTITTITFNIDQGTMAITLRPTVTWTPA